MKVAVSWRDSVLGDIVWGYYARWNYLLDSFKIVSWLNQIFIYSWIQVNTKNRLDELIYLSFRSTHIQMHSTLHKCIPIYCCYMQKHSTKIVYVILEYDHCSLYVGYKSAIRLAETIRWSNANVLKYGRTIKFNF